MLAVDALIVLITSPTTCRRCGFVYNFRSVVNRSDGVCPLKRY